jgi:hypothetical protein
VLFDNDTRFMYQGIFDTDFDKYLEDAIALFIKSGVSTVFENFENGSITSSSCWTIRSRSAGASTTPALQPVQSREPFHHTEYGAGPALPGGGRAGLHPLGE